MQLFLIINSVILLLLLVVIFVCRWLRLNRELRLLRRDVINLEDGNREVYDSIVRCNNNNVEISGDIKELRLKVTRLASSIDSLRDIFEKFEEEFGRDVSFRTSQIAVLRGDLDILKIEVRKHLFEPLTPKKQPVSFNEIRGS